MEPSRLHETAETCKTNTLVMSPKPRCTTTERQWHCQSVIEWLKETRVFLSSWWCFPCHSVLFCFFVFFVYNPHSQKSCVKWRNVKGMLNVLLNVLEPFTDRRTKRNVFLFLLWPTLSYLENIRTLKRLVSFGTSNELYIFGTSRLCWVIRDIQNTPELIW